MRAKLSPGVIVVFIIVILLLNNCERKILNVPATQGVARLPIIGNVEITLDFEAIGGKTVTVKNGNDRAVGVYIVKNNQPSIIVFSDGYIGKSSVHTGVNFEYGWELKVTVVIYKDLAGAVIAFIDALGPNFLDAVKEFWIERRHEEVVVIQKG